jgi:hypothetical protein
MLQSLIVANVEFFKKHGLHLSRLCQISLLVKTCLLAQILRKYYISILEACAFNEKVQKTYKLFPKGGIIMSKKICSWCKAGMTFFCHKGECGICPEKHTCPCAKAENVTSGLCAPCYSETMASVADFAKDRGLAFPADS